MRLKCYTSITNSAYAASSDPKVLTRIHVHSTVTRKAFDPKRVEQAVHLSAEITHDFEVVEG